MGDHLLDVRSSDRHTVKPWFIGKTDFAPRVVELTGVGFPLLGGRTEYLGGHVAAALVYGRRQHVINLFVWPVSPGEAASSNAPLATNTGYTLVHWIASGMSYRAVSDASPAELDAFRQAFLSAP